MAVQEVLDRDSRKRAIVEVHNELSELEARMTFSDQIGDLYDDTQPHFSAIRDMLKAEWQKLRNEQTERDK
jgi:hypothetical protein